jgi:two-component system sensor histidine kinase KdpD
VADRGPGVPVSERAHVFTPFYRGAASSAAPGVGLGLGIVYAIVHAHGGRVGVRNRPRGGAAFWFELPILDEPIEAPRSERPSPRNQRRTPRGRRRGASRA